MRNVDRIPEVLDKLKEVWEVVPDWRFMQLICNIQRAIGSDGFYAEDDLLIEYLNSYKEALHG